MPQTRIQNIFHLMFLFAVTISISISNAQIENMIAEKINSTNTPIAIRPEIVLEGSPSLASERLIPVIKEIATGISKYSTISIRVNPIDPAQIFAEVTRFLFLGIIAPSYKFVYCFIKTLGFRYNLSFSPFLGIKTFE